eukprot:TRINITY_DN4595_c0_g1_i1.p1 TRINITY_DN4595_c0_g1~~TRINITY_DN4595_c0_g1_i1.p1  ORF type:complete len:790 (-),score=112.28 TRINITY_DN4595_c0_g1_i1:55-2424(-)
MSLTPINNSNTTAVDNNIKEGLFVPLAINVGLSILFLSLFELCRRKWPTLYQPRCYKDESKTRYRKYKEIAPPPQGLLGWAKGALNYSDETLFHTHGLDALMHLRFLRILIIIVLCQLFYGVIVLFSVNYSASKSFRGTLLSLSMVNVASGSPYLTAHAISVALNTLILFYGIYKNHIEFVKYRVRYKSLVEPHNFAVLITHIPSEINGRTIYDELNSIFAGKVVSVIKILSTPKLESLLKRRAKVLNKLEKAYESWYNKGTRPVREGKFLRGKKVDSIDSYTQELNKLDADISHIQSIEMKKHVFTNTQTQTYSYQQINPQSSSSTTPLISSYSTNTKAALVVFQDSISANFCAQTTIGKDGVKWISEPAPEPEDLRWKNFAYRKRYLTIRYVLVNAFVFFLVFFWIIPVAFVSALSTLQNLSMLPVFNFLVSFLQLSPVLTGFVEGFLPTVVLSIFFAILVPILKGISHLLKLPTRTEEDSSVLCNYFLFSVFNIFLTFSIGASVFRVLDDILKGGVEEIINLLSHSIPQQATFYINYIMILSLSGHMKNLLRPVPLIFGWIKLKWFAKTIKERRKARDPGQFPYHVNYATHTLIFLITLTYSTMSPMILIFGFLYMCLAYISSRYNLIYVYKPKYEGGGNLWPLVFNRVMVACLIYHLTLVGVFGSYLFPVGAGISVLCAIATCIFWYHMRQTYADVAKYGSLLHLSGHSTEKKTESTESDAQGLVLNVTPDTENYVKYYIQSSLQPPRETIEIGNQNQQSENKHDFAEQHNKHQNVIQGNGKASY